MVGKKMTSGDVSRAGAGRGGDTRPSGIEGDSSGEGGEKGLRGEFQSILSWGDEGESERREEPGRENSILDLYGLQVSKSIRGREDLRITTGGGSMGKYNSDLLLLKNNNK